MKKTRRLFLIFFALLILASCQESKGKANEKPPTVEFEFPDEAVDK